MTLVAEVAKGGMACARSATNDPDHAIHTKLALRERIMAFADALHAHAR